MAAENVSRNHTLIELSPTDGPSMPRSLNAPHNLSVISEEIAAGYSYNPMATRSVTSISSINVEGLEVRQEASSEVDKRLGQKLEAFRNQVDGPVDDRLALSVLKRLAAHDSLPDNEKAQNIEMARREFFDALGLDVKDLDRASTESGRWLNIHNMPTDLLGVTPLMLLSVMGKTSLNKVDTALILLTAQLAVQAVTPYLGSRLMIPLLEIQRQVRGGISVRYGATGQLDANIKGMFSESSTLNAMLKKPNADASQLARQVERLQTQMSAYEDSANLNKTRYSVYLPENLVRMARATILVAGLWTAFAVRSDPTQSIVPYALVFQIASTLAAWVMHWTWAGPKRDQLLRDDLLKTDLKKFGPEIAQSLLARQQAERPNEALTMGEIDAVDDAAKKELRGLWKPQLTTKVGMARLLFAGEQRQLIAQTAEALDLPVETVSRWVDLRAREKAGAPPALTEDEAARLAELRSKLPSWRENRPMSALTKRSETLTHLSRGEESDFGALEAKEAATQQAAQAAKDLVDIEKDIAQAKQRIEENALDAVEDLGRKLNLVAKDLVLLQSGQWTEIEDDRKRLLDSVLTDTPPSNTFSMFTQYLFGCMVSDKSDLIQTAEKLAANVESQYHEAATITGFKYSKAFQMLFGGSATAMGIAASNKLLAAYGIDPSLTWRIASSAIPLAFVYAAEITGGVLVNQVLMDRADWRAKYAHRPPTSAEKFGMSMKGFMKGIVSTPLEIGRLTAGTVAGHYSRDALQRAQNRIESARNGNDVEVVMENDELEDDLIELEPHRSSVE